MNTKEGNIQLGFPLTPQRRMEVSFYQMWGEGAGPWRPQGYFNLVREMTMEVGSEKATLPTFSGFFSLL